MQGSHCDAKEKFSNSRKKDSAVKQAHNKDKSWRKNRQNRHQTEA